ncbi:MAG TPA: hypothetical protein VFQ05_10065 [Candidatus Eisenbacteria bacterium]|nr:hypothetical protein [Candidatus Eisenbacteria bacterium]
MKHHITALVALLGLSVAGIAAAAPIPEVSPLALPIVVVGGGGFAPPPPPEHAYRVRYRPRNGRPVYQEPPEYYRPARPSRPESFSQLHFGVQDVGGSEHPGMVFGFRGGVLADANIKFGGQIEWRHRGNSASQILSEEPGPGGTTITVKRDLARSSSDLIPIMGLLEIGGSRGGLMPYFGIAGGVEILHLSAEDFQTGERFDGNFVGWGWQGWGGMSMALSRQARLNGEVFWNGAPDLSRDVQDPSGGSIRESVDMSGAGARVGIAWVF